MSLLIGPSTGWLYARGIYSSFQQKIFLNKSPANSVEICLTSWDSKHDRRMISLRTDGVFGNKILYRSLHLPDIDDSKQVLIAQNIILRCNPNTALVHPLKLIDGYPVEYYKKMISIGIPLAIENMDLKKDSGFNPSELRELIENTGCRFVLDVQHAYEHDHKMYYAKDLLESLKNSLVHLHVSGEAKNNNHSLVSRAINASSIVEFIGQALFIKNVPLILEGKYLTLKELYREIEFLTKELGF